MRVDRPKAIKFISEADSPPAAGSLSGSGRESSGRWRSGETDAAFSTRYWLVALV